MYLSSLVAYLPAGDLFLISPFSVECCVCGHFLPDPHPAALDLVYIISHSLQPHAHHRRFDYTLGDAGWGISTTRYLVQGVREGVY